MYAGQDTSDYYTERGTAYLFAGDRDRATVYFDSLVVFLETSAHVRNKDNPQAMMGYALTLASLGRNEEAIRYADQAVEMLPLERDAIAGSDLLGGRMILHIILKDYDRAIRELEYIMTIPSTMTPAILRLHPGFDALRDNPRFKKLVDQKVSS
jgi:tetratricopeptide (TPR) repeat protein